MTPLFPPLIGSPLLLAGGVTGAGDMADNAVDSMASSGTVLVQSITAAIADVQPDTMAAPGTVLVQGSGAMSDAPVDVMAGSGPGAIAQGSGAMADAAVDTMAAPGVVLVQSTDGDIPDAAVDTMASSGTVGGGAITGSGAMADAPADTMAATGLVQVQGAAAMADAPVETMASSGSILVQGAGPMLDSPADSMASAGSVLVQAAGAMTDAPADVMTADGTAPNPDAPTGGGAGGGPSHYSARPRKPRHGPAAALRARLLREFADDEARKAALAALPSIKERERQAVRAAVRQIAAAPQLTEASFEAELEAVLAPFHVEPAARHLEWALYYLRVLATRQQAEERARRAIAEAEADDEEALALLL